MKRNALTFNYDIELVTVASSNKNARIESRVARNGKLRTETRRRDSGANMALSTDPNSNSTDLFIDFENGDSARLDGRHARTLYRLLRTHYKYTRKSR